MNRSRTKLVAAAALLVAVAGLAVVVAALAGGPPDPAANPVTPEEALATDAALYATEFGVNQPEAERRLSLQDEMWSITRRVADEMPAERHAGTWMYHEGGFGCVVWFTGQPDPAAEARIAEIVADAPAPVEIRWGATYSYDELRAAHRRNSAELWEYEGVWGLGVDAYTNTIAVTIFPDSKWAANPDEFATMLEERFGVPFTIEVA